MCGNWTRDGTTTRTIPDRRSQCENWNCDTDPQLVVLVSMINGGGGFLIGSILNARSAKVRSLFCYSK